MYLRRELLCLSRRQAEILNYEVLLPSLSSAALQVLWSPEKTTQEILSAPQPLKEVDRHLSPRTTSLPSRPNLHRFRDFTPDSGRNPGAHPSEQWKFLFGRPQVSLSKLTSATGKPFHL